MENLLPFCCFIGIACVFIIWSIVGDFEYETRIIPFSIAIIILILSGLYLAILYSTFSCGSHIDKSEYVYKTNGITTIIYKTNSMYSTDAKYYIANPSNIYVNIYNWTNGLNKFMCSTYSPIVTNMNIVEK